MSNTVTAIAKQRLVGSSTRKAVLMYMADNASDDGSGIWTSKKNMAQDLEMSRRTVQRSIQELTEMKVVFESGKRACESGFTVLYSIDIEVLSGLETTRQDVTQCHALPQIQDVTPCHPVTLTTPRRDTDDTKTCHPVTQTTLNHPEPLKGNKTREVADVLEQWASPDAAASFIAYRAAHKRHGKLTKRAAEMLANSLQEIFNAGHDPSDALGMAELRGWATVNLNWYENAKGNYNGKSHSSNPAGMGGESFLDLIAIAARSR